MIFQPSFSVLTYPEFMWALASLRDSICFGTIWPRGYKGYFVYFARSNCGLVKIGITRDPIKRIAALGGNPIFGSPSYALIVRGAPQKLERYTHMLFREQRYFGEWFVESGALRDFLHAQHRRSRGNMRDACRYNRCCDVPRGTVFPDRSVRY